MAKAVIPAKAGIQFLFWVPAFAGTTLPFLITRLPSKRTLFLATDIRYRRSFWQHAGGQLFQRVRHAVSVITEAEEVGRPLITSGTSLVQSS